VSGPALLPPLEAGVLLGDDIAAPWREDWLRAHAGSFAPLENVAA